MTIIDRERLRGIKTFPSLVKYLRDELDWPIEAEDFDELTFDYEPEELGLDARTAAKIEYIKQLRPHPGNQPWGIFFIKFEPKRLPVVVLRRILRSLVIKKRQSANRAAQATWNMHDLLFISAYGENDQRQITFSHFADNPETCGLPGLRVLGWDDADTALHIDYVHDELHKKLRWPEDFADLVRWRETWSSAFTIRHREVVNTSKQLAFRLAELARIIRKRVNAILAVESDKGPVRKLMSGFRDALIHDLSEDDFADMYAQTIAYGLLTARVAKRTGRTANDFAAEMPLTNPFLKELMETFINVSGREEKAGSGTDIDFDELGVREVVELLDDANMEAVLRDFGDRNPQEDPVIHFYELFLKEYDPKEKVKRGIFYTPRPIVSFIVRSVDELLRTEFGLEDGLADTTTWGEMVERHEGLQIPDGTKPEDPFVQILDPATGTGTFLVEVIDLIYRTMTEKWESEGYGGKKIDQLWNSYVAKRLLPRLYGYELLMAPYAIAHMKIGLKLYETGYRFGSEERTRVYLTNALEPPHDFFDRLAFAIPALAHEAEAVNKIKRHQRFTVIIGNPPYSGISSNRNKWIEGLLKGETSEGTPAANYYEADGQSIGEKKIWLQDDYVKFIRLSQFMLEKAFVGVHGMITNHSFVDSPTCRGMRCQMLGFFSTLKVVDLHGSTKKSEVPPPGITDENVFDILPGVAISICSRSWSGHRNRVDSWDLWGNRSAKFDWLMTHSLRDVEWTPLSSAPSYYLFVKRQLRFEEEYQTYYSLREIFPFYGTGIQTSRDDFATDYDRAELEKRLGLFFDLAHSDKDIAQRFQLRDTRGWKISEIRRTSNFAKINDAITHCLFRAFDMKWIALTKDVVDWPRLEVMSCVGPSWPGLLCSRQQAVPGFRHILVVSAPVDMFCISNKSREGQTLFPLFVYDDDNLFKREIESARRLNVGDAFATKVKALLMQDFHESPSDRLTGNQGRQVLNYVYALLHSPTYRSRYVDLLKMDYPRLPLTSNLELFRGLAELGGILVALHLMESPKLDERITTVVGSGEFEVEKVSYSDGTVWLDKAKTRGFRSVPEEVWNFHIGGYQVCEKWLKDRGPKKGQLGRLLSSGDILHYQKIVVALSETIRLMQVIDDVIEKHGGWPDAFAGQKGAEC